MILPKSVSAILRCSKRKEQVGDVLEMLSGILNKWDAKRGLATWILGILHRDISKRAGLTKIIN